MSQGEGEAVRMHKVGKVVARTVWIGMALIFGLYLLVNGVSLVSARMKMASNSKQVSAQLRTQVPVLQKSQEQLVAEMGAADAQWIEQGCERDSSAGGWITNYYLDVCKARSVTAWKMSSESAAKQRWNSHIGIADGAPSIGKFCPTVFLEDPGLAVDVVTGDQLPCTVGQGSGDEKAETRPLVGQPITFESGSAWLVVREVAQVGRVNIGCARWSVVFCHDPGGNAHSFGKYTP